MIVTRFIMSMTCFFCFISITLLYIVIREKINIKFFIAIFTIIAFWHLSVYIAEDVTTQHITEESLKKIVHNQCFTSNENLKHNEIESCVSEAISHYLKRAQINAQKIDYALEYDSQEKILILTISNRVFAYLPFTVETKKGYTLTNELNIDYF